MRQVWQRARTRVSSYEPAVVIAFLVASAACFAFIRLMSEMLEGETMAFDEAILRALRQPQDLHLPIGPAFLTKAFNDITSLGGVTVLSLITLLTMLYLLIIRKRMTAAFVALSVLGGWLVSHGLKIGVARPRPELVPHLVDVHDLSFPSGHAMLSAVTYLTIGLLLASVQTSRAARYYFVIVAILLTTIIGLSRVYLGVHYPTDVLGGWCAGAAWACLCWLAGRRLIPDQELAGPMRAPVTGPRQLA
ncbi:phosphatase PAP2 family protein [Rhizobium sp. YIM 134829]|uniref:phosphatase PAP2 family protein n=1 Tax=Rhizobium sp. YIM 134829 TaxID=3390453 RepID=UPI003977E5DD